MVSESGPTPSGAGETPDAVLEDVIDYFEDTARAFGGPPADSFVRSQFFDFDPLRDVELVTSHWVNEPFVYAAVVRDPETGQYRYYVFEPLLSDLESYVVDDLSEVVRRVARERAPDSPDEFETVIEDLVAEHAAPIDDGSLHKVFYYLTREFVHYGPIDPLMRDPALEEISCDGQNTPVYVYHQEYQNLETNVVFDQEELDTLVVELAQQADSQVSESAPLSGGTLPDGSRIQLTLASDIALRGSNFTIRRFSETPFTPVDLVATNTFSLDQMAFLWLAIANNKSIMFVGPTGSGKTTSMNAVTLFLPPESKVVSAERVHELTLPHKNRIAYVTREGASDRGDVTMYDILQNALHQRPEYILVGEIRTDPAVARMFFQSVFTGHSGGTTFHASTAENAFRRLRSDPLAVDDQMLSALDVVAVQRQVPLGQRERMVRRSIALSEVRPGDELGETELVDLFRWNPRIDTIERARESALDSDVLRDIADERGWEDVRVLEELADRRDVLSYLLTEGVRDYETVVSVFYRFARDRDALLSEIRSSDADLSVGESAVTPPDHDAARALQSGTETPALSPPTPSESPEPSDSAGPPDVHRHRDSDDRIDDE